MEQGPVLEGLGLPLAPVAAIAGQTRLTVAITGSQVPGAVDRTQARFTPALWRLHRALCSTRALFLCPFTRLSGCLMHSAARAHCMSLVQVV